MRAFLNFKIVALPSYFHFVELDEKVSRTKRKFVSSYIGILYFAPKTLNLYLNRIYVEIVHYLEFFSLAQKFPAGTSEFFPFGLNSDLHKIYTLCRKIPACTLEFFSFWRQLGSLLGMKIPGDSVLGIPLFFCWRLIINSFWRQLGSLLELSCLHLRMNSVWRQLGLPLGICNSWRFLLGDSSLFSPVGVCSDYLFVGEYIFCRWGFTILLLSWVTTSITKGHIAYVPLDPVAYYVHILDLNTRLRVG